MLPSQSATGPSVRLLAASAHHTLSGWLAEDMARGEERARWLTENHEALSLAVVAEEADALERKLDVLREAIMRLRPALRNGQIEQVIDGLVELARA